MLIGITGNIGSGKSTFSKFLKEALEKDEFKVNLINADKIGHLVLEKKEVKTTLIERWGERILNKNTKTLNRKIIRDIVFKDIKEYKFLCSLVWPKIYEEILKNIKDNFINILEAAVLIEANWFKICNKIILVKSYFFKRFIRKPFLNFKEFKLINSFQYPEDTLETYANFIITNNSSLLKLKKQAILTSQILKNFL